MMIETRPLNKNGEATKQINLSWNNPGPTNPRVTNPRAINPGPASDLVSTNAAYVTIINHFTTVHNELQCINHQSLHTSC